MKEQQSDSRYLPDKNVKKTFKMKKIKIVLVDDHQIVRDGIIKILADEKDFELIASLKDGFEVLEFMKKEKPDVIVADLSMPNISGIELTESIKTQYPDVKVLILSMFTDEVYVYNSIKAGAKGYLPKHDSTTETLIQAIRSIANGEEYYSNSIKKVVLKSYINNAKNSGMPDVKLQLTLREKEILKLFVEGYTNNEIANTLNISYHTVKTHKNNIMSKCNFKSTVEMIKFALKNKIEEW
jgi:DNA-binding NarL/FixJ family response regulator